MGLISRDLSEPYSIYTYRYFIQTWPYLCHTAVDEETNKLIGVVVGKIGDNGNALRRGYLAMLAVHADYRGKSIGSTLVSRMLSRMIQEGVVEVELETEATNTRALGLYAKLGFVRERRLPRYYLNGNDAFRLKLWIT